MALIGTTTLVPIEVLFAAGHQPVDMNNAFVSDPRGADFIAEAEKAGFPETSCAWLRGIYGTLKARPDIRTLIGATLGDCSDTHVLMEYVRRIGVQVIPFAYDRQRLAEEIEGLMQRFRVSWAEVNEWHERLQSIRRRVWAIDEATWQPRSGVSGWHNHLLQVSCSDMGGDIAKFEADVRQFRPGPPINPQGVRIGVLGVPSIFADQLYAFLERDCGAKVVFNETQRQFSLPYDCDLVEQYLRFTYPYGHEPRMADIKAEVARRRIDGLIHYVQAFCFRELTDALIREDLRSSPEADVPVLTITGNRDRALDAHLQTRLEAFVDMLDMHRNRPIQSP
ncbi:MAG: 2-hydroxyacyl-CoA dehydratase family protein [Armatimonadota bacterium]